jgi:hypothetical protein
MVAAAAAAATSLIGDQLRYEYTAHARVLFSAASVKSLVAETTHTANDDAGSSTMKTLSYPVEEHHGIPEVFFFFEKVIPEVLKTEE